MNMNRLLLLWVISLLSVSGWARDGEEFTAKTVEGIEMRFRVISENDKTCRVERKSFYTPSVDQAVTGVVTIPSNANGYKVVSISDEAFYVCRNITTVIIPNDIVSIGASAFYYCDNLDSIILPNSLESIGRGAFRNCSNLKTVIIPNNVTTIGEFAFYDCSSLTSVTIPDSVTSIGDGVFSGCSSLTSVTIPDSVTSIGGGVFSGCSSLTSVTLPNSMSTIGDYFFDGCTCLTSVTIPNNVTTIGEEAFYRCSSLTSVSIPQQVTTIEWRAFFDCSSLTAVHISDLDSWFKISFESESSNPLLYAHHLFLNGEEIKDLVIPDFVTTINENAFSNCSALTSVTIPNSVTSIGKYAFSYCSSLTAVHISDLDSWFKISFESVESNPLLYAHHLFLNGEEIKDLVIPDFVTTINEKAFDGCIGLTSVTIPNSVTSIGKYAFRNCNNLFSIVIPNSVTTIGDYAFGWTGLLSVVCESRVPPTCGNNPFTWCPDPFLFVPDGCIEAYRNAEVWKNFSIITTKNNIDGVNTFPSFHRSINKFYDYDGDGVMEMIGYHYNGKNAKTSLFGLMNDEGPISLFTINNNYNSELNVNIASRLVVDKYIQLSDTEWATAPSGSVVDLDNDGRVDFFSSKTFLAFMQQDNGSFSQVEKEIIKDSALIAKKSGGRVDPLTFNWYVKVGSANKTTSVSFNRSLDLNKDGRPDLFKGSDVFLSVDDNSYRQEEFIGSIYPYDLNGDGELDYLIYEGETLYTGVNLEGKEVRQEIFSNKNIKDFICRDFDHDGDIDPLAFVADGTNTYFVFMRNDGNGTFKKKESYITGSTTFTECRDYDADGCYEVLLNGKRIIKINKDFSLTEVSVDMVDVYDTSTFHFGDFNNDGYTEFKLITKDENNSDTWKSNTPLITGVYPQQTKPNTAPKKMKKPIVQMDEATGFLRIIWESGEDAETSTCDLTYDVRIGTAPGKGDVRFAPALADGRRRTLGDSSIGTLKQTMFNIAKYKPGTYYVSVQAIDAGGLGGLWSDEVIYEHTSPSVPVISTEKHRTTTVDSITVVASGYYDEQTQYQWSVSNGKVISQDRNQAVVCFNMAGSQQVMLTTVRGEGEEYQSEPLTIMVEPYKEKSVNFDNKYSSNFYNNKALDINQDGLVDAIREYLMINDGNGNFIRYPKSFNAQMKFYSAVVLDINKDGFPDITGCEDRELDRGESHLPKGYNFYISDGEGDYEYYKKAITLLNKSDDYYGTGYKQSHTNYIYQGESCEMYWLDVANTGTLSPIGTDNSLWTTDDYATFTRSPLTIGGGGLSAIVDINRDGFIDLVGARADSCYYTLGHANGDGAFDNPKVLASGTPLLVADLNNDGFQDVITIENKVIYIYSGCADLTWVRKGSIDIVINYITDINIYDIQDIDNNGFLDILLGNKVIYFYADFAYMIDTDFSNSSVIPFVPLTNGGYPNGYLSSITNQSPSAPAKVSVKQGEHGMVINWSDAADDHTPAMQMRYNVSVKRKGKTGENSYIISPMNGGSSQSNLVFPYYYKQSTTMTVPMRALTAGETYEVQVQAIDLWNQYSPMTEPVEITMTDGGYIEAPNVVATGREASVRYMGTSANDVSCTPGEDGTIVQDKGQGVYVLSWSTPGIKNVQIGNLTTQITVKNPVNVTFDVPETIYAGYEVKVQTNEEMAEHQGKCDLRVVQKPTSKSKVRIDYTSGSTEAELFFSEPGAYIIESYCEDEIVGNTFQRTIHVTEAPKAVISNVSVDAATGKYAISWPTNYSADIVGVEVLKEGLSTDTYTIQGTAQVADGCFIDKTSYPTAKSERYKMALVTKGGQRIESETHKPLHLMIGQSASGGYNLMWNAYEGMNVDSYQILRGTSADNLTTIDQLSSNQQCYTDQNAPDGILYYAISTGNARSNVISTESAGEMQLATSLKVIANTTDAPVLEAEGGKLQLYAILLPTYCYYNKVAWSIVEGNDLATISPEGLLTASDKMCDGTEKVKVRVSTLDGSNLSDEITVSMKPVIHVIVSAVNLSRRYGEENPRLTYEVENGTLNGIVSLSCEATPTSPVGTYEIVVSEGTIDDEKVIFKNGTLTITKAPLKASVGNYSREQGEENPEFEITYSGWKNGEDESVLLKKPVATTTALKDSPEGEYAITVSGGEAQNYEFEYVNGLLTVISTKNAEPYAILSDDNTVLTFYYDKQKEKRGGMDIVTFEWVEERGWNDVDSLIERVVFDETFAEYKEVTSTANWFHQCKGLKTIEGIENLNTSNVTDMQDMFYECSSLTSIDVSGFNTKNVTNMQSLFDGCSSLTSLDVSSFNTENVTDMRWMFCGCSSLTSLDLSGFNTKNVTLINDIFYGCSSLINLDVSSFNTKNVTDMQSLFGGCSSLTSIDVSSFNTENVTNMMAMFYECSSLTNLDVSSFNTKNVTDMGWMFSKCSSLTSLNISSFNTENVTDMPRMFLGCSALTTIYVGEKWSTENVTNSERMFTDCTSLVGGKGTVYDSSYTDATYARIDGGTDAPGYLTDYQDLGITNILASGKPFDVYTLGGKKVRHQVTTIDGLPKGIYVVAGQKVVVR